MVKQELRKKKKWSITPTGNFDSLILLTCLSGLWEEDCVNKQLAWFRRLGNKLRKKVLHQAESEHYSLTIIRTGLDADTIYTNKLRIHMLYQLFEIFSLP